MMLTENEAALATHIAAAEIEREELCEQIDILRDAAQRACQALERGDVMAAHSILTVARSTHLAP